MSIERADVPPTGASFRVNSLQRLSVRHSAITDVWHDCNKGFSELYNNNIMINII